MTISSAGKSISFTGWKVGWATGSPELIAAVRTTKQYLTFAGAGPFQYAVAEALRLPDVYFTGLREGHQFRRDLLSDGLAAAGLDVLRPAGTYFVSVDISGLGEGDGVTFCRSLPARCGVVGVPHSVFHDDPDAGRSLVRFVFCKQTGVLEEAVRRFKGLAPRPDES